jgi:hypothetical protein
MTTPMLNADDRPSFANFITMLNGVLEPELFQAIADNVSSLVETERSYLPAHKKGGTVAYSTLRDLAPRIHHQYLSGKIRNLVSEIVGLRVFPTPDHDESSCSILFYDRPGDHIGWHYDHNFYRGRHFTVLIPIVNRGPKGELSAARLFAKIDGSDVEIATPPNRLVLFEGAKVRHMVTPIAEGERRVVWSMTYCTDPRNSALQGVARRIKDTAFFGMRSLWT